jgi:hypothetical protein
MGTIQDIDRPDINEIKPKMFGIRELADKQLKKLIPFINVKCDDNIMSSLYVIGSFDEKSRWENGIFLNSQYFQFSIMPENKKRYYECGEKIVVELKLSCPENKVKFRKSTTTPEKAIANIMKWILAVKESIDIKEHTT